MTSPQRDRRGRRLGSGPLQRPMPFVVQHSRLGKISAHMSEAAKRTFFALRDLADEQGLVTTNFKSLREHTLMSKPVQGEAIRELLDLHLIALVRGSSGGTLPTYRVLARGSALTRLQYVPLYEPAEPSTRKSRYKALLEIEITAGSEADVRFRVEEVLNELRLSSAFTAQIAGIERLQRQR